MREQHEEPPLLPDVYEAPEETVQAAHDKLAEQPQHATAERKPRPRSRNGRVVSRTPDPLIWEVVLRDLVETGKDATYLIYNEDGSIVIDNHPQR